MATILKSQLDLVNQRRSADDLSHIVDALRRDGSLTVKDDPEPEKAEPQLDDEGNEVKDTEGNVVLQAPAPAGVNTDALDLEVDKEEGPTGPVIPEGIIVEVAPGTQNAAAPFPEDLGQGTSRSRGSRDTRESKD